MNELLVVCQTVEINEGQASGFVVMRENEAGESKPWPILITRKGDQFFGFENNCPHQRSRLDVSPGQFLDRDGNFISCGKHHALFDLTTGECSMGPCQGQRLTPIQLEIAGANVCVTRVSHAK